MQIGLGPIHQKMKLFQIIYILIGELTNQHLCRHHQKNPKPVPSELNPISLNFMIYVFPKRVMAINSKRAIVSGPVMVNSIGPI